ncbi:MAG TPA: hypothetical protein H9836_11480 [Candidatus Nocardiopsis merdipullorum]|nr:hypothetical protein [Candidatus Nocardiopsis merdipullorum]
MSFAGGGRRPQTLTAVRLFFLLVASACLALPFFGSPDSVTVTGLQMLSLPPGSSSSLVLGIVLLVCATVLTLVHGRRPSIPVLLGTLLATLLVTGLVVHRQRALDTVLSGQDLPGYWIVLTLLVGSLITVLVDLLHRDVEDDITGTSRG